MKALVTGGAGFIGSHIVDLFLEDGHTVWVADDLSTGRWENVNERATFARGDITNFEYLWGMARNLAPDVIIHQAAQASLLRSVDDPILDAEINIIGTLNVIQVARNFGARVVMASTSAVYPNEWGSYEETLAPYPTRPYGIAKCAAEMYLRSAGISYAVLRYGNVYGPRQVIVGENQLVPHVLNYLFGKSKFVVNGDGEQSRDFVYVKDIARANLLAAKSDVCGIYNAGTGKATSVNKIIHLLRDFTGNQYPISYGPPKPNEPRKVELYSATIAHDLGWQAQVSIADGLRETVEWRKMQ